MNKIQRQNISGTNIIVFHELRMSESQVLDILYRQEYIEANEFIVCKGNLHVAGEVWEGIKDKYFLEIIYPPPWPPIGDGTVNFSRIAHKDCYFETRPKKKHFYLQIYCKNKTYTSQGSTIPWNDNIGVTSIAWSHMPFWMLPEHKK